MSTWPDSAGHRSLDTDLAEPLRLLQAGEEYGRVAAQALKILENAEGETYGRKLIRPGWREFWAIHRDIAWALLGSLGLGQAEYEALRAVFAEIVRLLVDATTRTRKQKYAERLLRALSHYLELRGWEPETEPETETAQQESYVTLDQAAAHVGKSKRTLERYTKTMPAPKRRANRRGRAHEWAWSELRPWLEKEFSRILPDSPHNRT